MEDIIKFENVSFYYDNEENTEPKYVLKNLSLTIEKGSFVCIMGHNGCGKSTLAKLSNAILKPVSGKVIVDGIDTSDDDKIFDVRKTVGMVFQNPDNQIVATIVEDDVAFGPENLGVPREEIRKRVDEALENVGMTKYRDREPHKLSGGQKQRVAIAGVIAMQTDCIAFDEPTAMLDPRGRKSVMKTIKKLNKELGITVLYITHYMDEAVQADRVIVLDSGNIVFDDVPKKVFAHISELKKLGLDVPQSTELAYNLKNKGINIRNDILSIEEFSEAFGEIVGGAK